MNKQTRIFLLISTVLAVVVIGSLLLLNQQPILTPTTIPLPVESPYPTPTTAIYTPARPNGGAETEQFQSDEREFLSKTPLLQKLPYDQTYFTIDYIDEHHLIVHARTDNKERDYQSAKNWFVENDIDTRGINIEYR